MNSNDDQFDLWETVQSAATHAFVHLLGTALVAALLALGLLGPTRLQAVAGLYTGPLGPRWSGLALHLVLSASTWGLLVTGYYLLRRRLRQRRDDDQMRIIRSTDGSVMVETLIVLPFFLLVTSGIAQLTMINIAGVLSDLAAWDAARAAWIWEAERNIGRDGVDKDTVWVRAISAAAMSLAPTAGTDYTVGRVKKRGSRPPFRRTRTAIAATFRPGVVTGENEWSISGNNWQYFNKFGGTGSGSLRGARGKRLSFAQAFDSMDYIYRAGRKCTQAFMSLENDFEVVRDGNEIGVHFTYKYNLLFPWYAYIFGNVQYIGMRTAYYTPIEREFMFPKQTQF